MPSRPPRKGRLFYKVLSLALLISLFPVAIVGWNLIGISQRVLKDESLRHEQSLAIGFAETVQNYVTTFKKVLSVATQLEGFASMDSGKQERLLNRVMQQHAAFSELSVFDAGGQETVHLVRFLAGPPPMRKFSGQTPFQVALQGGEYVGSLERSQGLYPALTIAVPIYENVSEGQPSPKGVFLGKISLVGLSTMLQQEFPEKSPSQAAVVAGDVKDNFLVAHSNEKLVYNPSAKLPQEILQVILTQVSDKGGGRIDLKDGAKVLGAYATVKDLGWIVYVQQPIESAYLAASEMSSQIFWVLIVVILFAIMLSVAVTSYITQPIRSLREAADMLKLGRFENLPEMALTNDEIGELAQSFAQMSESLKEKTGELLHAKEELEKFTKFLEKRVESRTRELKAAQDELIKKERLATIGQMASVVGHEIRNPLAVINNSIFFIKTKLGKELKELDPKVDKHITIIESEIKQANSIINEILTYSRSRELKCEVISLNAFLEDLLLVYPFPARIEVVKNFDPTNPSVNIDADEMRQAVRNLMGNSVEVMPNGGMIRVATRVIEGGWARIDIADSGSGIAPDVVDKIFAPFFTTKARGTGLGLAVVRKVMDRHQGKVEVESQVGKGTVFKLYLLLASPVAAPPVRSVA